MSPAAIVSVIKAAIPEAIGLIEALIEAGKDPVVEVRRMRTAVEQRRDAGTEDAWEEAIETKPRRSDTQPSMPAFDVYEELD